MFTKNKCGYCVNAKKLLESKKRDVITLDLIVLDEQPDYPKAKLMMEAMIPTVVSTVPQIFIGTKYITGGYTGLALLDSTGELDDIIREESHSTNPPLNVSEFVVKPCWIEEPPNLRLFLNGELDF